MQEDKSYKKEIKSIISETQKDNFRNFMKMHNLNVNSWCKKAGIREATLRHFLSGRNLSITTVNLELLARAINISPNVIL